MTIAKFCIFILFFSVISATYAENEIILTDAEIPDYNVTEYLYLFEDKNNSFEIEQVLLFSDGKFTLNKSSNVNLGVTESAYWIKFAVNNSSNEVRSLLFSLSYPFINHIDFYQIKETKLLKDFHTGELEIFNTRDLQHRDYVFNLKLDPKSQYTYIAKIYNSGETLLLPMRLTSYQAFISRDSMDLLIKGFFYGLLIFVIIFNSFLYVTIRERLYIFYSIYVITLALFIANSDGLSFQLFWPNFPVWADKSTIFFVSVSNFFLILFTKDFLKSDKLTKGVDITLKSLLTLASILIISSFIGAPIRKYAVLAANLLSFLTIVSIIVIAILAFRKKVYGSKFFLISFFVLMVGVIVYVMRNMGILPSNVITGYGVKLGFVTEVILLSFAASDRFRINKEKINEELEKLVKIRTSEISQQKEEISAQRDEIESQRDFVTKQRDTILDQKQEITDSIHYAKRIQNAILPQQEFISTILPNHFIYFKPRDIVSGDFYWMKEVNNKIIFCVADSTGHGVPGAFMSMLGITSLNEIVNNNTFLNAGEILDQLRKNIVLSLHQTGKEGEAKDGMDISLCVYDKSNKTLDFAGANNPLYVVKSEKIKVKNEENTILDELSTFNFQLDEVKGDKMPISIYDKMEKYTNHTLKIEPSDIVYLFSDGIADQFGGKQGKKFKYKQLKQLLVKNCHLPMFEQKEMLIESFEQWKGDLEQIDDILIMGVRFE